MALRRIWTISRVGTKAGLAGGSLYLYYEIGLWKSSDETIQNYDKFKKDVQLYYDAAPTDVKKWAEYGVSSASSTVEPYCKSVSEFRKEWLNFDLSWLTERGDGVIKPTWNRAVSWTVEAVKDSPQTIRRWSSTGWEKITDMVKDNSSATVSVTVSTPESKAPSMKQ